MNFKKNIPLTIGLFYILPITFFFIFKNLKIHIDILTFSIEFCIFFFSFGFQRHQSVVNLLTHSKLFLFFNFDIWFFKYLEFYKKNERVVWLRTQPILFILNQTITRFSLILSVKIQTPFHGKYFRNQSILRIWTVFGYLHVCVVQYWSLLFWRNFRFRCGFVAVAVNLLFVFISSFFAMF